MSIISTIKERYNCAGGYREFLKIALPLIFSLGLGAIEVFTDRTFLSWYSQEAFAASAPAGCFSWAMVAFFMGSLSYVNVFVAQYYGKKEYRSIGPAIWQSVYLTFAAALILFCISFLLKPFFMNIGHPEAVAIEEIKYSQILAYGAFVWIGESVLSTFYSGRGKTVIVLMISLLGAIINTCFDYLLIFGKCDFAEMGITGAAMASNTSYFVMCIVYIILITSKKNHITYDTRCMKLNFKFMKRLLHYGIPNGVELFFDGCGFSILLIIIGTLGVASLAASNIMASIYNIAYMPLLGAGMATSVMVGKYLGKNKASCAQLSLRSSLHISYIYVILLIIAINVFPDWFLSPFAVGVQADFMETVKPITKSLLIILSIFFVFDTGSVIFSSVLRGAGDTAYVMKIFISFSIFLEVIPAYLNVVVFKNSITTTWACFIVYVVALCFAFLYKYKTNKWKKMRVIEMEIIDG
ncbi:MAG: MATE family efflux transporter [Endomicrobium sp.]|jgi:MATE family multidrug resistance protein|nr:MATE family efflux transporter [Endomicrobium sp.]